MSDQDNLDKEFDKWLEDYIEANYQELYEKFLWDIEDMEDNNE